MLTIATVALALFAAAWSAALIVGLSAGLADASVSGSTAAVVPVDAERVWRARDAQRPAR